MKVYNQAPNQGLDAHLEALLRDFRKQRNFEPELYLEAKSILLNEYMRHFGLKSCVVGVSGGIDSAVTLGIVKEASAKKDSPIERIIPVFLPALNSEGATNQEAATSRGQEVVAKFELESYLVDISKTHQTLKTAVDQALSISGQPWASGQLVAYVRTPILYYITSLLTQEGKPAIVCGTTNRDEGAYLGYFGKASDGMVDLQLISDLHKSEVYAVGRALNLPESVLKIEPTGDMYDGRVDKEVFGAPYDFVEIYLQFLTKTPLQQEAIKKNMPEEARKQFDLMAKNLENLHKYNGHKYLGKSPAIHLDLYESGVPGGWMNQAPEKKVDHAALVGELSVPQQLLVSLAEKTKSASKTIKKEFADEKIPGFTVENLLGYKECDSIIAELENKPWVAVGTDGYKRKSDSEKIGSYRSCWYNEDLAKILWERLEEHLSKIRLSTESRDDHDAKVWKAVGISPLIRFIKYGQGGELVVHSDQPYHYNSEKRTLMSCVIYLNPAEGGGSTRFVKPDITAKVGYGDWERPAHPEEVALEIQPERGTALLFDHYLLHDGRSLEKGTKIIIRTDIIYEKGGPV